MRVTLDYDKTGMEVEIPDENIVGVLKLDSPEPLSDPASKLREKFASPSGCESLSQLAQGKSSACIVICDLTRPVPNQLILEEMLPILEEAGIPRSELTILIATGLHRPNLGDEIVELVGEKIAREYRIENHHGKVPDEHEYLGESPRGVPIWIDKRYSAADLKITVGLIEPHLMAGYSGGRKLICPGIAALETVKVWHGPKFLEHPHATYGILKGNPVHEESTQIALKAGCNFIVNVTLDENREMTGIFAGEMQQAFLEGVSFLEGYVKAELSEPCDIIITSSAGYPLDTTFYQSIKGLVSILPIVKQGGTVILAAGLTEGIGSSEFQQLFRENESIDRFMHNILHEDYFVLDQWQLEEMAKVSKKTNIVFVSQGLDSCVLESLYVESSASVEAAIEDALKKYGPKATIAVVPKGPYVLPTLVDV